MKKKKNGLFSSGLFYVVIFVALLAIFSWFFRGSDSSSSTEVISSSTFMTELKDNDIKSFSMQPSNGVYKVTGSYRKAQKASKANTGMMSSPSSSSNTVTHFSTSIATNDSNLAQVQKLAANKNVKVSMQQESNSGLWVNLLTMIVPMIIIIVFFYMMMGQAGQGGQGGRMMGFGKSRAKKADKKANKVRFSDVAGEEEEKQELVEVVEFLKDTHKFNALGARIPHGVLLEGPPGTGKTLLAKAVAGEAGVPFYSISGSDFVEMFVGVGASRVRDLFDQAKKNAPAIIFIDEIDAVGRKRGVGMGGGHDEREQTLNQLLVEMDGFTGNEGVIVIAATNRSDVLDPALLRPGRFDRKILVGRPDVKGREAILKVHAKGKPLAPDVSLREIARETPGFVGADLENLLNEGALVAARRGKKQIDASDLDEAEDRVIAGPAKRDRVMSKQERLTVAYHEAGHALIGLVLSDSRKVRKVTIVPRGRAGGYAVMLPRDDEFLLSKKELLEQITGLLGGRTAEEIIFNQESSGASNDFEQATQIARAMVTQYGMSDKLGTVTLEKEQQDEFSRPVYSEKTAAEIDEEVRRIIDECHKRAHDIIEAHREQHKLIAEALLKYETLNEKQILSLFNDGKMPDENPDEFPSEKVSTFEEAKKALETKDAKRQASEEKVDEQIAASDAALDSQEASQSMADSIAASAASARAESATSASSMASQDNNEDK
ncbi:MAG: ATP-dependent zinc metalloprotease FtsH [Candidatus Paralactobacillus gallistercoris]|uniref:ATP-dependent zinc metalloprotease FtsH n=1 Tax=Candidatus Paralactobacillus gallistercoris TaxID=2838724 RepID=A0A948TJV4_9LACO|nr:ATP-dependent zinc metalloprotease FtsH [Candidatus Paralactobacillus gallistercoris]